MPSNSKVWTSRSGRTTSRHTPLNAYMFPSGPCETNLQTPPGLTSILSTVVTWLLGPHHCGMSFGSVTTFQTCSRGASRDPSEELKRLDEAVRELGQR